MAPGQEELSRSTAGIAGETHPTLSCVFSIFQMGFDNPGRCVDAVEKHASPKTSRPC